MPDLIIEEPLASRIRALAERQDRTIEDLLLEMIEKSEDSTRTIPQSTSNIVSDRDRRDDGTLSAANLEI
jgi:hypothetical protein